MAGHPLQEEIRRFEAAEANLRRLGTTSPGMLVSAYDLPALPRSGAEDGVHASTEARRALHRDLFRRSAEKQTQAYLDALAVRQERLMDQKYAERMAELTANDAAEALAALAAVNEQIRARLMPLVAQKLVVISRIAILDAQLPRGGVPSTFIEPTRTDAEREALQAERAKLERDPNASGISWRVRLRFLRDREANSLDGLNAAIDRIMGEGGVALGNASGQLMEQRRQEIEAELAKDRARFLEEQRSLETALRAAVRGALEKERETSRLASVGRGSGGGPVRLDDLFGPVPAGAVGARAAADRVERQRAALQRYIEHSIVDAVRDAAQARGIDVKVVPGVLRGEADTGVKDRVDMTSDFATWIRIGGQHSVSVGGGRV